MRPNARRVGPYAIAHVGPSSRLGVFWLIISMLCELRTFYAGLESGAHRRLYARSSTVFAGGILVGIAIFKDSTEQQKEAVSRSE